MPRPPTPTAKAATQPAPKPLERPSKPAPGPKVAPTPPTPAAPSKTPARVRRRARIEIPPTTAPAPTATPAHAKSSGSPAKADQKEKAKASPAQTLAKAPKTNTGKPKATRGMSALDAAAMVLEGLKGTKAREGIQANDLIDRMQRASLWASPGGKTPAATLYAAIIREIKVKKGVARFVRVSPGHFAIKTAGKDRCIGAAE